METARRVVVLASLLAAACSGEGGTENSMPATEGTLPPGGSVPSLEGSGPPGVSPIPMATDDPNTPEVEGPIPPVVDDPNTPEVEGPVMDDPNTPEVEGPGPGPVPPPQLPPPPGECAVPTTSQSPRLIKRE